MANRPVIIDVGRTKFGEHYEKKPEQLIEEAWIDASEKLKIDSMSRWKVRDLLVPLY